MTDTAAIIRDLDADRLRAEAQAAPHLAGVLRALAAVNPCGENGLCHCCRGIVWVIVPRRGHKAGCPYWAAVALLEGIGEAAS